MILYEGLKIRMPQEVVADVGGRCPSCGRELEWWLGKFDPTGAMIVVRGRVLGQGAKRLRAAKVLKILGSA